MATIPQVRGAVNSEATQPRVEVGLYPGSPTRARPSHVPNGRLASFRACASLACAALASLPSAPAAAANPPSAEGSHYAVTTESADATLAAIDVLDHGGSAADAAIAAALVLGVVAPAGSGLGGGGFALVYTARDKSTVALDFREAAPAAFNVAALFPSHAAGVAATPSSRGATIGIPGEVAGLAWLHRKLGKLPFARDVQAAELLARGGFRVSHHLGESYSAAKIKLTPATELYAALGLQGEGAGYGALVKRPKLAATLATLAAQGPGAFYTGSIADGIVASAQVEGSMLTREDLRSYAPIERAPLRVHVGALDIATMPAPSAGGLMLAEALVMHGTDPAAQSPAPRNTQLANLGWGSSAYQHVLAETMRGALADRFRLAGDPAAEPAVTANYARVLEPDQLRARRARISLTTTHKPSEFRLREQGTTHLTIVDSEGNIVSLTTTVNTAFGSGVETADGIVLNDQMTDFSDPDSLTGFGVVGLGPNRARPGARPVSSMTPTIAFDAQGPIAALGGSGGPRIATGVTQVLLSRLYFGCEPSACVSAPRFHIAPRGGISVESEVPLDVREGLTRRGETVSIEPNAAPSVNMITLERSGATIKLRAGADPRKDGFAAAR
jgi:gamma-glutamyltranspeptidase / glutathione hydrolase